jgi:hypothetical protein
MHLECLEKQEKAKDKSSKWKEIKIGVEINEIET